MQPVVHHDKNRFNLYLVQAPLLATVFKQTFEITLPSLFTDYIVPRCMKLRASLTPSSHTSSSSSRTWSTASGQIRPLTLRGWKAVCVFMSSSSHDDECVLSSLFLPYLVACRRPWRSGPPATAASKASAPPSFFLYALPGPPARPLCAHLETHNRRV